MPQGLTGAGDGDAASRGAHIESEHSLQHSSASLASPGNETTTEELESPPGMAVNPQAMELAGSDTANNGNLDPEERHSTSEV